MSYYTYIIGWEDLNTFYYGVRLANTVEPENDLWIKYFTSSKKVEEFRKHSGEPSLVKIDKVFSTPEEAAEYEIDYLLEHKCIDSPQWLNKGLIPATIHDSNTRTRISEKTKGHKKSKETRQMMVENHPRKRGDEHHWWGRPHTPESLEKIKESNRRRAESGEYSTPKRREKIRNTQLKNSKEISERVKNDWKNESVKEYRIQRMKEAHSKKPHVKCPYCEMKSNQSNIVRHIRANHKDKPNPFEK